MPQHGGYRRPRNPAPVSGPGALSRRTDGGPTKMEVTDLPYGEAGALNEAQSAAPLAPQRQRQAPPQAPLVGLADPTAYPNQPVTAGADAGPGPTSADIGLAQESNREIRAALGPRVKALMRMADAPYSTPSFRRQVRQLIARINA